MGTPTNWRNCSLRSAALERIELVVGNVRTASERSPSTASGHRALAACCRLVGGVRRVLNGLGLLPPPKSIQFVRLRVSSDARLPASLEFRWRSDLKSVTAGPLPGGVRSVTP
jgi:hypothetical protein